MSNPGKTIWSREFGWSVRSYKRAATELDRFYHAGRVGAFITLGMLLGFVRFDASLSPRLNKFYPSVSR